jgi:hypothetical protein
LVACITGPFLQGLNAISDGHDSDPARLYGQRLSCSAIS